MSSKRIHELIAEHCPDGVQRRPLGEVVQILDSQRKPISKDKRESGAIPYYGANGVQGYVKNYIFDGTFLLVGEDGSVINKDYSPVLHWATGQIWVNNHAHVLGEKAEVALLRFIFYALSACDVSGIVRGVPPKINQASLRNIEIPLPPLAVQLEIVRILDAMTSLQAELQAELAARRSQLEFYRNSLMNFNSAGSPPVRWITLGELADLNWGDTSTTKASYVTEGESYLAYSAAGPDGFLNHFDYDKTAVVLSAIGALSGKTWLAQGKWSCIKNTIRFFSRDEQVVRTDFLFWYTSTPNFWPRRGSAQPFISKGDADKISIPVPSLEIQNRVVQALTKIDALSSDISIGLPAEIDARRKQYEYYRGQLLTFKELAA